MNKEQVAYLKARIIEVIDETLTLQITNNTVKKQQFSNIAGTAAFMISSFEGNLTKKE